MRAEYLKVIVSQVQQLQFVIVLQKVANLYAVCRHKLVIPYKQLLQCVVHP
ncbi:hypothetical protein DPMN_086516 [Dreissena polymorpha]|uniref:Uncharacterized protein n=1 Tax=Dreissena polymorpha TaxID=45954 RepID=A0A9D4QW20_DREPO|nr:hypothetical protein DPMN_086516 [Dreissena polymorpha]